MQAGKTGLGGSIWASGSSVSHVMSNANTRPTNGQTRSSSVPAHQAATNFIDASPVPPRAGAATNTLNAGAHITSRQALHRLEQVCIRLRWKSLDLENSYQRTLNPVEYSFDPANAEQNFKVDFYEFYAWIEQALVLLQRIFGVEILAGGGPTHAYHHNVLQALLDPSNPLHPVLGKGEVIQALWKAKELRNRWKFANTNEMETPPLRMYDLSWIVRTILYGLDESYSGAAEQVQLELMRAGANGHIIANSGGDEENWDWMVESMDWEA
jgi:hypothetical protein